MAGSAYASPCTDFNKQDFDELDGRQVVAVCTTELSKDPNNATLQASLGLGYDKLEITPKRCIGIPKPPIKGMQKVNTMGLMYDKGYGLVFLFGVAIFITSILFHFFNFDINFGIGWHKIIIIDRCPSGVFGTRGGFLGKGWL